MKKNIDILLSVIDNFGDMGFACELLTGLHRVYPGIFEYHIWTDDIGAVTSFLEKNRDAMPQYRVNMLEKFGEKNVSRFCISLFHGFIPDKGFFHNPSMILRVDYLSLDPLWLSYHAGEHIGSSPSRKIIEIIPSPLPQGGGIFPCPLGRYSRSQVAELLQIDISKQWISIFSYPETLSSRINFTMIPHGREVLILGAPREIQDQIPHINIHFLPFLPIELFHHILAHSLWSIIRGEISWMNVVALGKPFFWDMYKSLGGFPEEQSRFFLDFIHPSPSYRDIHNRINKYPEGIITLQECEDSLMSGEGNNFFKRDESKDLVYEVKKFIDSFYFSL